jgi:PAS domain S-box-containing protein
MTFSMPIPIKDAILIYMIESHKVASKLEELQSELATKEAFINTIIDSCPVPIWISDNKGTLIRSNPALRRILNYSEEQIVGKYNVFEDPVVRKAQLLPKVRDVFEKGIPFSFGLDWDGQQMATTELKTPTAIRIEATMFPIFDPEGQLANVALVWTDDTERVLQSKKIKDSKAQLKTLIDTIPDLIWLKNPEGVILNCNQGFAKMLGFNREELIGKSDYELFDKEIADYFRRHDQNAIDAGVPTANEEEVCFEKASYTGLYETIKTPMRDTDGDLLGVLGIARDISERTRAAEERIKLELQLKQSQKMETIGNLAGGIAHDFNNILASIIGFTEFSLTDIEKGSPLEENLNEILNAANRARDLVKQILTFARRSDEIRHPLSIAPTVLEVIKLLRSSIPTSIQIERSIDTNSRIMGNETQIHQVILNLCANAAHAMEEEGGVLTIRLTDKSIDDNSSFLPAGDYVQIDVQDTGRGIDPMSIEKIFEPYFTTKGHGKGTGMGLAVVHGIVEEYGGQITVSSQIGEGTTISVFFPTTTDQVLSSIENNNNTPGGKERILFVDDEVAIAKMAQKVLENLGYKVVTSTDSLKALAAFEKDPDHFDLVITDATMPNMTGDVLTKRILELRPNLPVILCSGYSDKVNHDTATQIGAKTFLAKPFSKAEFTNTIRKALDTN